MNAIKWSKLNNNLVGRCCLCIAIPLFSVSSFVILIVVILGFRATMIKTTSSWNLKRVAYNTNIPAFSIFIYDNTAIYVFW